MIKLPISISEDTKNFYRLSATNEGEFFKEYKEHYYGIVVNAHLAAAYDLWSSTLLQEVNKPFIVDPFTFVFGLDINNIKKGGELKVSYDALIKKYGKELEDKIKEGKLIPQDFRGSAGTKFATFFADKTLTIQKDILKPKTAMEKSLKRYAERLERLGKKKDLVRGPEFLIAPYFYFRNIDDPWYEINLMLAQTAGQFKGDNLLFTVICMNKDLLANSESLDQIVNDYKKFNGIILWISDFNEEKVDVNALKNFKEFMQKFATTNKPLYNFYAGNFTLLLTKMDNVRIDGYSRGICYGESKDVESVPAGLPPKRYYFPLTHSKLVELVIREVLTENPTLICKCRICSDIVENVIQKEAPKDKQLINSFFQQLKFNLAKEHFILCHSQERQNIFTSKLGELKIRLSNDYTECQKLNLRDYDVKFDHINKWINAL